ARLILIFERARDDEAEQERENDTADGHPTIVMDPVRSSEDDEHYVRYDRRTDRRRPRDARALQRTGRSPCPIRQDSRHLRARRLCLLPGLAERARRARSLRGIAQRAEGARR